MVRPCSAVPVNLCRGPRRNPLGVCIMVFVFFFLTLHWRGLLNSQKMEISPAQRVLRSCLLKKKKTNYGFSLPSSSLFFTRDSHLHQWDCCMAAWRRGLSTRLRRCHGIKYNEGHVEMSILPHKQHRIGWQ